MQRLADVQSRVQSLGELQEVITALRSVSAARVQQSHAVLDSMRQYTAIVQDALSEAARGYPLPRGAPDACETSGLVVAFGSEHGFVGAFNERVLAAAATGCRRGDALFVVGSRAILEANERHRDIAWSCAMASQVGGIDEVALRVAEQLGRANKTADMVRVVLVYTRTSSGVTYRIVTETLLPFDVRPYAPRGPQGPPALSNLSPRVLLDGLIEELLFAQLAHAATESFASENAARLAAMESASDNVATKLDDLRRVEGELRQEEITTELIDVITGVEAVMGGD
jgi:F-type H+-transporting ATPase subunit gamma